MAGILWLGKRRYMAKDLLEEHFGRYFELPRQLALRGHPVHSLLLSYRGEPGVREQIDDRLILESIDLRQGWRYIRRAQELARHPETSLIVGSSDAPYCILADHLGRRFGRVVIQDIYDDYDFYASARIPGITRLYRRALARADCNIVFTEVLAEWLAERVPMARFEVVPIGIDHQLFRPLDRTECRRQLGLPTEGVLIGYFGAIQAARRLDVLFDAHRQLRSEGLITHLVLAGADDGTLNLDSVEGLTYLGERPHHQVPILINACDVNVSCRGDDGPTRTCFPFKTFEYAACQVPFAVPDTPAMARYFAAHPSFLYRLEDPADLARTLRRLLGTRKHHFPTTDRWEDAGRRYHRIIEDLPTQREAPPPAASPGAHGEPGEGVQRSRSSR